MSQDDVKGMMHDILKGVAIERGWLSGDDHISSDDGNISSDRQDSSDFTVVFETLTRERGISIEFEPLGKRRSRK